MTEPHAPQPWSPGYPRPEPPGPPTPPAVSASSRRVLLLVTLFYFWDGVPFAALGVPRHYGAWIVASYMVWIAAKAFVRVFDRRARLDRWETTSLVLMGYCIAVSAISNTVFFPQSLDGWLPALYIVTPMLIVFAPGRRRFTSREILDALVLTGVTASALLLVDHLVELPFLDQYQRVATTDTSLRRIIVLKSEAAFAFAILFARVASSSRLTARTLRELGMMALVAGNLMILSESRLAIAATLIGAGLFMVVVIRGSRRVVVIGAAIVALAALGPFVLGKYVDQLLGTSDYVASDASITFRLMQLQHFYGYFLDTYGLGFGIMSTGTDRSNILAYSINQAGYDYGTYSYGLGVADLGILGALMQFGYLGVIIVLYMTLKASIGLLRGARAGRYAREAGAVGALMFAFMLSPWPYNFFTLQWTVLLGNVIWALAATSARESRESAELSASSDVAWPPDEPPPHAAHPWRWAGHTAAR